MTNYREINYSVMIDTKRCYETMPQLQDAVKRSIENQFMVAHTENIDQPQKTATRPFVISGKRTLEAAKGYPGKKVAVLNFANNHSIGGAPFSAGAQEESICRCSTLYPCLQAMDEPFYRKHQNDFEAGKLDALGNDDLIYTPEVVVFKTDERTDPVIPQLMAESDWYKVDVITCAAPQIGRFQNLPDNYEAIINSRIKKIIDVAAQQKVDVLILGAWGCGAFHNSIDVVARVFREKLQHYDFETVEFALATNGNVNELPFARALVSCD